MFKEKDFEYDIYSNNGQWFVKIKQTGEICQIDKPLLRYLRSEEKKITRSKEPITDMESYDYLLAVKSAIAHPLSTDCLLEDEDGNEIENAYFASSENIEDSFILKELMDEIFNSLTEVQKKVFISVLYFGESVSEYSKRTGVSEQNIYKTIKKIRQKIKVEYFSNF